MPKQAEIKLPFKTDGQGHILTTKPTHYKARASIKPVIILDSILLIVSMACMICSLTILNGVMR